MDGDCPSRSSRIAILVHSLNEGGAQQRLVSLANRFAARGRSVDFVTLSGAGMAAGALGAGVRRLSLAPEAERPPRRILPALGALKEYLARDQPAVLIAGTNRVHGVAALACAGAGRPPLLVLRFAGHPLRNLPWSRPWKRLREVARRPIERWALGRADLIIAVSRECAAVIGTMAHDPARIVTIPNPTITPAFRASLEKRAAHRWFDDAEAGGDPVILGIGRIGTSKDFETLVEAVGIANRSRGVKLILLGEGKRRGAIEALVAKCKLVDRVELAGHVNHVGAWLARANMLVSSSLWEGSPGVIIEAFEAGVPVVATACPGGSVELLEDGTGGMLVPVRNPAAMAAAIVTMLARPRDRNALRALARPFQDDGRADIAYLEAIDATVRAKRAATPDRAPPLVSP